MRHRSRRSPVATGSLSDISSLGALKASALAWYDFPSQDRGVGFVATLRRSGDNAERTFYWYEFLDETAEQWVTNGGGDQDGFVVEFKDLSGNSNDFQQTTATNQPLLVSNGALLERMEFDSSDNFVAQSGFDIGLNDATFVFDMVVEDGTPSAVAAWVSTHNAGNNRVSVQLDSGSTGDIRLRFVDDVGTVITVTISLDQTIPDNTPIKAELTLDRDGPATFTWRDESGNTGTGSEDISSTATINIGDGNTNPATFASDTDTVLDLRTFAVFLTKELTANQLALLNRF